MTTSRPPGCARCRAVKLARALGYTSRTVDTDHLLAAVASPYSIGAWLEKRIKIPREHELRIVDEMQKHMDHNLDLYGLAHTFKQRTPTAEPETFGSLVRARLYAMGRMSQSELARRMGYSGSGSINCYIVGRSTPGLDLIMRCAAALECSPRDLVPRFAPGMAPDVMDEDDDDCCDDEVTP